MAIWVAGEDFGGIFTGRGTDPSTGPLLILLAAARWPQAQAPPDPTPASALCLTAGGARSV